MFKWPLLILSIAIITGAAGYFFYFKSQDIKTTLKSPASIPVTSPARSLVLQLQEPESDILTFTASSKVSGKTSPNTAVVVSTDTQDLLMHSDQEGNFSTPLTLNLGVNKISVVAFDSDGDKKSETRVIYYSKEKI